MSGTRWLGDDEQAAWRGFMHMHSAISAEMARRLSADSPLSLSDYEVLVTLTDHPEGQLRVMDIASALGWEKSRVSHQISRMSTRGLVERLHCETDGRGLVVAITDNGLNMIRSAAPGHVETVRELFIDRLSPSQLNEMREIAEQVLAPLDKPRS